MSQRLALTSLLAFLLALCLSTAGHAQGPDHNQVSDRIFNHSKVDDDYNQEQDLVRYIAVASLVLFGGFFIWPHK
jgi:hypothetical protein